MTTRRFLIFVGLAVTLLALPWAAQASNYANSPYTMQKFVDVLPGLGAVLPGGTQYIPVAKANIAAFPGSDYYEIALKDYSQVMHSSLAAGTRLRGYVQVGGGAGFDPTQHYLGPIIVASKNRPVRIKFTNSLGLGAAGNLFLPVDTAAMGAGTGPLASVGNMTNYSQNRAVLHLHGGRTPWISDGTPHQWLTPAGEVSTPYLKGASFQNVPDMVAPLAIPNTPGDGIGTFYYTNAQSSRLMFYHDHALGITRLNVYAGEAAGYIIHDAAEDALISGGTIPSQSDLGPLYNWGVPLVIQDKTFVPPDIATQDPTAADLVTGLQNIGWNDLAAGWGGTKTGDLWFPHVYEFNQSGSIGGGGVNPEGRWDYGPFVAPPATITDSLTGFANILGMPLPATVGFVPQPSMAPEAFMDTMVVNGMAFPKVTVSPKAYRFRILNASNDRTLNLQLYYAANNGPFPAVALPSVNPAYTNNITNLTPLGVFAGSEVSMVKADGTVYVVPPASVQFGNPTQLESGVNKPLFYVYQSPQTLPPGVAYGDKTVATPFDGRVGGVPDPRQVGPQMIQIGNEGGLLPAPIVLANNAVDYTYDRKQITFGNVRNYALDWPNPNNPSVALHYPHPGYNLHLGPAERADIIIDFSSVPSGSTLILYNDGPAPQPGFDPRYDYYYNDPDYSATGLMAGGAKSTAAGFGPNTRTVMQINVSGAVGTGANLAGLQTALPTYFNNTANQPDPILNQTTWAPVQLITGLTGKNGQLIPILRKAIAEDFDPVWGRMNAVLGTEVASTNSQGQATFGFHYVDPFTELINPFKPSPYTSIGPPSGIPLNGVDDFSDFNTQIWKFVHNGVDTHAIHFHLFDVQVVNRVDWAGVIKPPDPNELGWKDTVRMNPLEDCIVALRPTIPPIPASFNGGAGIPNSVRPKDPTMPQTMVINGVTTPFTDSVFWTKPPATATTIGNGVPTGLTVPNFPWTNPFPYPPPAGSTTANVTTDFGWEYVFHCHLLGHEENDMMRAVSFEVAPAAPTLLTAKNKATAVSLAWTNNETVQTSFQFLVQKSTTSNFTTATTTNLSPLVSATNNAGVTYTKTDTIVKGTFFYRVRAQNGSGFSAWSNTASVKF